MFTVLDLVQPDTIEEAYNILIQRRNNTVLGGCAFLRLGNQKIGTAIDLTKLSLDTITEHADFFEIGAMTTFRALEIHPVLKQYFQGVISQAVRNVVGVQFRNVVTVGATVYAKYGFSDLITALLALDTEVGLYHSGRMSLAAFLDGPVQKDIVTHIWIAKNGRQAAYQSLRNSASDYPILNVAVSRLEDQWLIVVGARPFKAAVASWASMAMSQGTAVDEVAELVAEELAFGSNLRSSGQYRQAMSKVLVKRAIAEVLQCK